MVASHSMSASPAREFAFVLHDVARLLRTYADKRVRALNMTRAQWAVLVRLQRFEGVNQSELAEMLDLQPITLARLIDKLCAVGLVERRDDAKDRRANRLFLTEKAAPLLERLGALGEDLMGHALEGFDAAGIADMTDRMNRIKSNLKRRLNAKD
jgi:MarR family transcriptional regulator, transcriptional regulator for hemolysin